MCQALDKRITDALDRNDLVAITDASTLDIDWRQATLASVIHDEIAAMNSGGANVYVPANICELLDWCELLNDHYV